MDDDLFNQLKDVFAAVDEEDIVDLHSLTDMQLLERFADLDEWIKRNHQVLNPDTQEARDVHSERNAIQLVLKERGRM